MRATIAGVVAMRSEGDTMPPGDAHKNNCYTFWGRLGLIE